MAPRSAVVAAIGVAVSVPRPSIDWREELFNPARSCKKHATNLGDLFFFYGSVSKTSLFGPPYPPASRGDGGVVKMGFPASWEVDKDLTVESRPPNTCIRGKPPPCGSLFNSIPRCKLARRLD